jgi:perosamine synthetase
LIILEDAAQGVGVKYKGKHVGSIGQAGVLSYYGNKTITCGEGGIILTNSSEFRDKVYAFKNHGRLKKGTFVHDKIGYNFAFTEMQAAIGVAQMGKLNRIIHSKNKIFENYRNAFPSIKFLERTKNTSNFVPWFTTIFVENPRELQDYLFKNGVSTRLLFPPLDSQPCFRDLELSNEFFPNSYSAYTHGISLPSSVTLTERQQSKITRLVNQFYA